MTISYSTGFTHLIFRWYGSIWRSIYKEIIVFLALFYSVRAFYNVGIDWLDPDGDMHMKSNFEAVCRQFNEYLKNIPLTFLLGFYVSNVVSRWWRQFECLNWPEDLLGILCVAVPGDDERSRKLRHRVARYMSATYALAWRDISDKIRAIFPHERDVVDQGLLTEKEYALLKQLNNVEECPYTQWLTPLHWIQQLMHTEVKEHEMPVTLLTNFLAELKNFRTSFRRLFYHDWVCVPLVYTQVAAIATYGFFFFALFGRQHIGGKDEVDMIFPLFTVVQFLFFVGWYKVGLDLMRPFGLDDDDIELSYILERNMNVSFGIVNRLQASAPPPPEEDRFWLNGAKITLTSATDKKKAKKAQRAPLLNTFRETVKHKKKDHTKEKHPEKDGLVPTNGGVAIPFVDDAASMQDVAEKENRRNRVAGALGRWMPKKHGEKSVFYW